MSDATPELVSQAIAAQTSSHSSSAIQNVMTIAAGAGVATGSASQIPVQFGFWGHMAHLSLVCGLLLCLTGLYKFVRDERERYLNRKIGSGSGG